MKEFIKDKLYTNPHTRLVIQCTRDGVSPSGVSGTVVDRGNDKYEKGHKSRTWNEFVFIPCEIYQEPELNVIL